MQELQTAKIGKYYDWQQGASKIENAAERNAYIQSGIGYGRTMGLSDDILNPEGVKKLGTDENQQRMATLDTMVRNNQMTPADAIDLATNSLKADKFLQVAKTPLEFMNKRPDLTEAQEFAIGNKTKVDEAQANRDNAVKVANIRATGQTTPADKEINDFTKTVANASSRTGMGRNKMMMDAADSTKTMVNTALKENGIDVSKLQTPEQWKAALNGLNKNQVTEIVKSQDKLLSQANPTVHGQEGLAPPDTPQALVAKYGSALGNAPLGTDQGSFLYPMLKTNDSERAMNAKKYQNASEVLMNGHPNATKKYGTAFMQQQIDKITGDSASGGASTGIPFMGHNWTADQLRQTIKDHPNSPNATKAQEALDAAGGG